MLEKIASITKKASETGYTVEFVATDATRAENGFVAQCAKVAVENGATEITVCDDAGIAFPCKMGALIKEVCSHVLFRNFHMLILNFYKFQSFQSVYMFNKVIIP